MNAREMKKTLSGVIAMALLMITGLIVPTTALAFVSGSTSSDGDLNPTVDTQIQLPPDGVLNYTSVNIPPGVIVTFQKNATNTPVTMLVSGDATIAGEIRVNGSHATHTGSSGDGNLGDDGLPGLGGPGGFDGGAGAPVGTPQGARGEFGLGPGGGSGGQFYPPFGHAIGGNGGAYGSQGNDPAIATYGSPSLLPLIGGSGGAGGFTGTAFAGAGGGGAGGAILIAVSGTLTVSGSILANGGNGGNVGGGSAVLSGAAGGAGSGGGIRLVATTLTGNGTVNALPGSRGTSVITSRQHGGGAGVGRIRLEAETITRTSGTNPAYTFVAPQDVFVAGLPSLTITSVAGVTAPAAPTGNADITLPETTPNPVTVEFAATSVPLGSVVSLRVTPSSAAAFNVTSNALAGTEANSTASVGVNLPPGPSVLSATTSFTVIASVGDAMSNLAMGERVQRVILTASLNGVSETTLVTVSGKRFTLPANVPLFPTTSGSASEAEQSEATGS